MKKEVIESLKLLIVKVVVIIVLFFIIFNFLYGLKRIENQYMEPSIVPGDLIIYFRMNNTYNIGDPVVVNKDNKTNVYRVVALGGDVVDITKDNKVLVNNHVEDTTVYFKTDKNDSSDITFPYTVPNNEYFVLGDFRTIKNDSRAFGSVSKKDIKGIVIGKLQTRNI